MPEHVKIKIDPEHIEFYSFDLRTRGYKSTIFQVVRPFQVFGLVKQVQHNNLTVEHHVRAYTDGIITSEIELRRIDDMWLHLTSKSRSAHERVIIDLMNISIPFEIDQKMRAHYNTHVYEGFPRDFLELPRWFFIGVCIHTPLGYLWKGFNKMRHLFSMTSSLLSNRSSSVSSVNEMKNK